MAILVHPLGIESVCCCSRPNNEHIVRDFKLLTYTIGRVMFAVQSLVSWVNVSGGGVDVVDPIGKVTPDMHTCTKKKSINCEAIDDNRAKQHEEAQFRCMLLLATAYATVSENAPEHILDPLQVTMRLAV
mmetsp:Transcript_23924/g.49403  ORF Transcript_23924/g.49403 Transcript_23924/m.49403 type:complete len:130 (+) Transcript_23924:2395-2784(+)